MSTIVLSSQVKDIFLKDAFAHANTFLYYETVTEKDTATVGEKVPGTITARSAAVKQSVSGFVLDSKYFVDLQAYVYAGVRLPQSEAAFNVTYPEHVMQEQTALKDDKGLYQFLRTTLLSVGGHCTEFQTGTMSSMINTGGRIANYAKRAEENMAEISRQLQIITAPNSTLSDQPVKTAIVAVRGILRPLIKLSKERVEECEKLGRELADFQTKTINDEASMKLATDRFEKIMPVNPQGAFAVAMANLKIRKDAAMKTYNDRVAGYQQQLRANNEVRWYHFIPFVGFILSIFNSKQNAGIVEALKQIGQEYQRNIAQYGLDEVNVRTAYDRFTELTSAVKSIQDTIGDAIVAVGMMRGAFSNMTTEFEKLRFELGNVLEYAEDSDIQDRLVAHEELDLASKTWGKIYFVAKQFQDHGALLEKKV